LNASALYLGQALGSAIGGYALAAGQLGNLPLFGALFVAGALGFMLLADARTARVAPASTAPVPAWDRVGGRAPLARAEIATPGTKPRRRIG
jgi:hypothetical protein